MEFVPTLVHYRGVIAMWSMDHFNDDLVSFSINLIYIIFEHLEFGVKVNIINVYTLNKLLGKRRLWRFLVELMAPKVSFFDAL